MARPVTTFDRLNATPVWIAPNPTPATLFHTGVAGSYLVASSPGWITGISVNTTAQSGTLTVYDGVDASGAVLGVIDVSKGNPNPQAASPWPFRVGLFLVLSGNADITIVAHS
jgi:hypothetical protein